MDVALVLVVLVLVLARYADLALMAALRLVAFGAAIGAAVACQTALTGWLVKCAVVPGPRAAVALAWLGWLVVAAVGVRRIARRAQCGSLGTGAAVALEVAFAALCFSLVATAIWALPALVAGRQPQPTPALLALVAVGAVIDLLRPQVLDGIGRRLV